MGNNANHRQDPRSEEPLWGILIWNGHRSGALRAIGAVAGEVLILGKTPMVVHHDRVGYDGKHGACRSILDNDDHRGAVFIAESESEKLFHILSTHSLTRHCTGFGGID